MEPYNNINSVGGMCTVRAGGRMTTGENLDRLREVESVFGSKILSR